MINGIGTDIIEVSRIHRAIMRYDAKFLDRIYTLHEQEYCKRFREPARHFAGRFAAKEAVVKAMGLGFAEGVSWLDIEICNNAQGKPEVFLSPELAMRFPNASFLLSISHCKEYATATAIRVL